MRIVAGTLRGRTIDGPSWDGLRPTSDSLRETLFNIVGHAMPGARVLDVFAGTGAVGFEALSRGAARVTFVERDKRAITLIDRNITRLGVADACAIIRDDFMAPRRNGTPGDGFDFIFLDPPYDMPELDAAVTRASGFAAPGAMLVLEHSKRVAPPALDGAAPARTRVAGDSALSFYTWQKGA
jgi:16S rRNA (guanine966-N2)-methyltransferase